MGETPTPKKPLADPRLLRGAPLQQRIVGKVAAYFAKVGQPGRLVSIAIGETPEVEVYIRNQARVAARAGIPFDEQHWPGQITQEDCKARIQAMNDDPTVLGIIVQRPAPAHINLRSLQSAIHPLKDVEGMNPASIGNIVYNDVALAPCTAAASVALIKEAYPDLKGVEVVMIGHSEIVGKPAALMLMAEGATVTVCHHMTRSVAMHSRRADVVIVAVGRPGILGADMVKPGCCVIDIGINQVEDGDGNTKIVGDADLDAILPYASWITPVPGGVGPVTVGLLMQNAQVAHQRQSAAGWI